MLDGSRLAAAPQRVVRERPLPDGWLDTEITERLAVVGVVVPACRIFDDVLADTVQSPFGSNDVLVVVALPDLCAWLATQFVNPLRRNRLERANQSSERLPSIVALQPLGRGGS